MLHEVAALQDGYDRTSQACPLPLLEPPMYATDQVEIWRWSWATRTYIMSVCVSGPACKNVSAGVYAPGPLLIHMYCFVVYYECMIS